jgi:hypothetical protein
MILAMISNLRKGCSVAIGFNELIHVPLNRSHYEKLGRVAMHSFVDQILGDSEQSIVTKQIRHVTQTLEKRQDIYYVIRLSIESLARLQILSRLLQE